MRRSWCYPVMAELRPHLVKQAFVSQVRRQQQHGYYLAYLEEGEDTQPGLFMNKEVEVES
jgi:hypothetical protein